MTEQTRTDPQEPVGADGAPRGLSASQVRERVRRGLTNAYREPSSRSAAAILRTNLLTVFNAILGVALVVVLLVGQWVDALFGFVLVLNTATGTLAEVRAKRALDRLSVLQAPTAHVRRDGREADVDVADIVLDDVVRLRSGEQVPADGELLTADGLEIDESILTGESDAVRPEPGDRVLSGTTVTAGEGLMRATAVGERAYAHRLAREARRFSKVGSELQEGTDRVLRWISWVIVPVALLLAWSQISAAGGWQAARATGAWRMATVAAIAGVVGMVPQGLVLLTSVNFATASLRLARRRVLVQELPAVEVLARVDTLCLDKTGTITTGRIRLERVEGPGGAGAGPELRGALAALTSQESNATALAVREGLGELGAPGPDDAGGRTGADDADGRRVPFSSRRKWSAAGAGGRTWVMGAPEIVLDGAEGAGALLARARELAGRGLRVVGLAVADSGCGRAPDGDAALPDGRAAAGLVVLAEEVRPDAERTLAYFRDQGVRVKVISGDNPVTVAAVARRAGVRATGAGGGGADESGAGRDGELAVVDARTLPADASAPEELDALADSVEGADVLGRVTPEQKRAFVRALRRRGRTVAMTGDGVNDALALKDADLGIAMGNGAPATRAVARLVLLSGEFSALPGVVAEGRRVMANTERIASLFLSKTVYASLIAVVVALTAISYPFLPRQLTIVSSLTIGIPAFVLALAPNRRRYRSGFLRRVLVLSVPAGLVAGACTLAARTWLAAVGAAEGQVTTGATLVLVACGLALLTLTARPLWGWRLGLIVLMGAIAVMGVLVAPVRAFFLLEWPAPTTWLVIAVMTGVVVALMHLVGSLGPRLAGPGPGAGRPRADR
ncbi:HAD-IC family P-type ATPase [Actinomyces dentalis]|uniref:HAD-IC family P-type ATPase n=1 Tax=Actinomyces dentalis TaxID=272548 RepID=UPI002355D61A|nr:HAD-IC family P-type ATPase [Actinomyces dentalis]